MKQVATCECEALSVSVDGSPDVLACNCLSCQRRTGSVFGVSAYFSKDDVTSITGEYKEFKRESNSSKTIAFSFCPTCGTNVFWTPETKPDLIGIAVGCFGDPQFPKPEFASYASTMHAWVIFPDGIPLKG